MWDSTSITDAGIKILAQWIGGKALTVTKAKIGKSVVSDSLLKNQTNVSSYECDAAIVDNKRVDEGIQFTIRITPSTNAFTAKQIGIFGKLDGGSETLLALYQDSTGIEVPSKADMGEYIYDFYAIIASGIGNDISVNITTDNYATVGDVQKKQDIISDLATIRAGAAKGATALQEHQSLAGKQDVISDLATIRAGAAKGATALQEHQSLAGKQDVITDLATIRSGAARGMTALQTHQDISGKQDKISDLATIRAGAAKGATALQTHQDISGKQDKINDLATIRAGAAKGATALQEHQDISGKQDKIEDLDDIRAEARQVFGIKANILDIEDAISDIDTIRTNAADAILRPKATYKRVGTFTIAAGARLQNQVTYSESGFKSIPCVVVTPHVDDTLHKDVARYKNLNVIVANVTATECNFIIYNNNTMDATSVYLDIIIIGN